MSEGASFVHTQRWPVSPSSKPPVASGLGTPLSASGGSGGGRMPAATSGPAAGQQQPAYQHQPHNPSVQQLGRAQSEMVPRGEEHADHLKKLHTHWSDTGLLQGHLAGARQQQQQLQQQLRWQLLTNADRGGGSGDEAMRDRRNSIDSAQGAAARAQGAAARARGGRYAPPFQVDPATSPQVVQAALDEVDYVQRHAPPQVAQGVADDPNFMQPPNVELAFVRGDPSGAAASTVAWLPPVVNQHLPQAGMQQWHWPPHLATSPPARTSQPPAAAGASLKVVLQPSSTGQSASFGVGDGRSTVTGGDGTPGSTTSEQLGTGVWESSMFRHLSGSDFTVEDIVQVQRSRMEKLKLELDKQSACLARLHAAADHLAFAIEEIRTHGQAAAATATAAIRANSGSIGGQVSAGRTKEMIVKLRLDNSNLLVHIEELQKELTMLHQGGGDRYVKTQCRDPVEVLRWHSVPSASLMVKKTTWNFVETGSNVGFHSPNLYGLVTPADAFREHTEHPYTWPRDGVSGHDPATPAGDWVPHSESLPSRSPAPQLLAHRSPDREVPHGDSSTLETFAPAHKHDEGDGSAWNCDICTFLNHGMLNVCEICEAPRMTGRPGQRAACCHQQGGCYCHVGVHGGSHL